LNEGEKNSLSLIMNDLQLYLRSLPTFYNIKINVTNYTKYTSCQYP